MSQTASISATQLLAGLDEQGVLPAERAVTLLGELRHNISLNQLEIILVEQGVLTDKRLLQLKGAITGLDILDDESVAVRTTALGQNVVRMIGAFVLDLPELTAAMVEDLPQNIEVLKAELKSTDLRIKLITANQFNQMYRRYYQGEQSQTLKQADIYEVLDEAVRRRASDIHLSVGEPPAVRVDGSLVRLPRAPLSEEFMETEILKMAGSERMEQWRKTSDVDFAYAYGQSRFRVNLGADQKGMTVAARKIPTKIPTMDELGLPMSIRKLCELERGLILVVGPTGSGKSTTLAAMLASIATDHSKHIITLEDPIEFQIPNGRSVVHQRELYDSFHSFPGGLRQALRQDPDVVLVGELRDSETIKTALTAAETGHLVFGTLHTFDAPQTVSRIVSSFGPEEQDHVRAQLAYILKGVVAQTLLPLSSTKGRVAAFEIMVSTPAIQNNLRKVDGHNQLRQTLETSTRDGMQTMEMSLADLVRRGLVSEQEAEFRAPDKESFLRRLESGTGAGMS